MRSYVFTGTVIREQETNKLYIVDEFLIGVVSLDSIIRLLQPGQKITLTIQIAEE